ncbi:MAG: stage III sporulation protein AE [Clostridia bacterium]|nr:stage III sporulation protein AE [Clostridia bacterium]
MKKKTVAIFSSLIIFLILFSVKTVARADENDATQNLDRAVEELIDSIDFDEVEKLYSSTVKELSAGYDLKNFLLSVIDGKNSEDYSDFIWYAFNLFKEGVKSKIPIFVSLFVILILCGIINSLKNGGAGSGVMEIAYFAAYSVVICSVVGVGYSLVVQGKDAVDGVAGVIQAVFPIMLSLMTATGNAASAAVYSPTAAFICEFIVIIIQDVIFPLVIAIMLLSVVSNLNKNIKLKGAIGLCSSVIKWIIGLIVAVFSVFLTVKGLTASMSDGVSLRAIKYTINSSIPIVGGVMKDGFDIILASAVLLKNSLGALSAVMIFGYVIGPIVEIVSVSFTLKLINAVTEPIGDGRTFDFVNTIGGALNYVVASVLLVSLSFIITVIMMIITSQSVL